MCRVVIRLLLILLIAALLNLAVAWLIAWRYDSEGIVAHPLSDFTRVEADGTWWQGRIERGLLTEQMQIVYDDQWTGGNQSHGSFAEFAATLPRQVRINVLEWRGGADGGLPRCRCFMVVGRGWPFPSFYLRKDYDRAPQSIVVNGGWVIRPASSRKRDGIELPFLPLWPGIALNMAVYVPLVAMILWNVGVWRQWRRYRRGRCPRCGHDLCGNLASGCSRCGWRHQSQTRMESV